MHLLSPAKINLFLKVVGKRGDGFHDLVTLIQAVDLVDELVIEESEEERFSCSDPSLPVDGTNLVCRARDLFRAKTGVTTPVSILLEKRIPHGAGLGGGSGNAATTLWALNRLFATKVPEELLQEWSAEVGSDCPFFFSSGRALCRGRGERVESLEPERRAEPLYIVHPHFALSTPSVFAHIRPEEMTGGKFSLQSRENDLERVSLRICPELAQFRAKLLPLSQETPFMTGSGSAYVLSSAQKPEIPECAVYSVRSLHRKENQWYERCNESPL